MSQTIVLATTKLRCCASCTHSWDWGNSKGLCGHSAILEMQKALFPDIHKPAHRPTFSWRFARYMGDVCRDHYELASSEQMQERLDNEKEWLRKGVESRNGISGTEYGFLKQLVATWEFLLDAKERMPRKRRKQWSS